MTINSHSTIAILGGAGKAGRPLVQEALSAGYRVRLLLRHPAQFDLTHERLHIISGDARDPAAITLLLLGCDALLSTLGNPKGETTPIIATVTEILIRAMQASDIRRYVVVSGLFSTGTERHDDKTKQAAEFMQQHYPMMMADRRREFQLLSASPLDWTYVRIPYLVSAPVAGRVSVHPDHLPGQQIAATDLAHFLIGQLTNRQYIRQSPFVASN